MRSRGGLGKFTLGAICQNYMALRRSLIPIKLSFTCPQCNTTFNFKRYFCPFCNKKLEYEVSNGKLILKAMGD